MRITTKWIDIPNGWVRGRDGQKTHTRTQVTMYNALIISFLFSFDYIQFFKKVINTVELDLEIWNIVMP
jgi:hypothetical protein